MLFTALEGLVYPDFGTRCVTDDAAALRAGAWSRVGGIDFGWRNPFAAVWGVLDRDDVLWIGWERYLRETPLHLHAAALRRTQGASFGTPTRPGARRSRNCGRRA